MEELTQRIANLEARVDELTSWQNQVSTLLTIVAGAVEPVIEPDDDMH